VGKPSKRGFLIREANVDYFRHKPSLIVYLGVVCALLLGGCTEIPASLDPQGPAAGQIASLGWLMIVTGTLIWVGVTVLLVIGLFRRKSAEAYTALPEEEHARTVNFWIVGGGIVMPTLVLIILIALTIGTLRSMPAEKPLGGLMVEVIGHQWWWEVRYPGHNITLKDEVRVPAGEPVVVSLSSADVIHSFWVPELHGKFDLIPGRTYEFVLQADQPGKYDGRCAEFCGLSHTLMTFTVVAMQPEEFTTWLGSQVPSITTPAAP
jgi:cytochrome c oxidase subunit 2